MIYLCWNCIKAKFSVYYYQQITVISFLLDMKSTILSKKDAVLLEETVAGFGRIVTFSQLHKVFKKEYDLPETRNRISLLAKTGWLSESGRGFMSS